MSGIAKYASRMLVSFLIAAGLFWCWQQITSVRVDGSKAACEAAFPDKKCMILWVPE